MQDIGILGFNFHQLGRAVVNYPGTGVKVIKKEVGAVTGCILAIYPCKS